MGAVALCGFFLSDYPVITAVYADNWELFKKYCFCKTKRDFNSEDSVWKSKDNRLWYLLKSTLLPVLELVRKTMPVSAEPLIMFRGISFNTFEDLKKFLPNIKDNGTLTQIKSWTMSLEVAMKFSDPNGGLVGKMNLMQRLMMRRGLNDMSTTKFGVVLIIKTPGISVEQLAINRSENEFWLTGENKVLDIQVTREKEEIEPMLDL